MRVFRVTILIMGSIAFIMCENSRQISKKRPYHDSPNNSGQQISIPSDPNLYRMTRLTQAEWGNSIRSIFSVDVENESWPVDTKLDGYINNKSVAPTTQSIEQTLQAAADVSDKLNTRTLSQKYCTSETCGDNLVSGLGQDLFRRPLDQQELNTFKAILGGGSEDEIKNLVKLMLSSPQFIYRVETGTSELKSYENAQRVSFFLTGGPAISSGQTGSSLVNSSQLIESHADSFGSSFGLSWLETEQVKLRPDLEESQISSAEQEFSSKMSRLFSQGMFANIFESSRSTQGSVFEQELFLMAHANENHGSPTHRGRVLYEKVYNCESIPPPPPDVDNDVLTKIDNSNVKTLLREHSKQQCASCHQITDPIGFLFEDYDNFGRSQENQFTDETIEVVLGIGGKDKETFTSLSELLGFLKDQKETRQCFVSQLLRFRAPLLTEQVIEQMSADIASKSTTDTTLKELLTMIVNDQRFANGGAQL